MGCYGFQRKRGLCVCIRTLMYIHFCHIDGSQRERTIYCRELSYFPLLRSESGVVACNHSFLSPRLFFLLLGPIWSNSGLFCSESGQMDSERRRGNFFLSISILHTQLYFPWTRAAICLFAHVHAQDLCCICNHSIQISLHVIMM